MTEKVEVVISNLSILIEMIEEAHKGMSRTVESHRTPKEGGGYILEYDPDHRSLKESIKVIILVGAALEALWHLKAVKLRSKTFAEKMDRDCKSVSAKYACLGISNDEVLGRIDNYYDVRRQIVHEKAHSAPYQKNLYVAQVEASSASKLLFEVKELLEQINA